MQNYDLTNLFLETPRKAFMIIGTLYLGFKSLQTSLLASNADLSLLWALDAGDQQPPWYCRFEIYNQRSWLSLAYRGPSGPLGACPTRSIDKSALLASAKKGSYYHVRLDNVILKDGDQYNSCQVIYSQFGLAIHQNDHQARRRFVEWAQNGIAVVPDFHKRILFSDETNFWLNGYVNKQNCRIWSEANPQVYVETPLQPEKLTVWCALWAGGILLQKR
ncbi:hypothetical protein TNCV_376111 [Trichonephila clavipes]|nr:hypothetical protein TNCV_376111 [Trichonephila clavipes]